MSESVDIASQLRRELDETRARLAEAEEALDAIRNGEVDGLMMAGPAGEQVFTLQGAQEPYRLLIEQMGEGAATLSPGGTILYANQSLARLLQTPLERVIGAAFQDCFPPADEPEVLRLMGQAWTSSSQGEMLIRSGGALLPVRLGFNRLQLDPETLVCVVVTDLTEARKKEDEMARLHTDLERRVVERTADLARSRLAALNMMEEAVEARLSLEAANRLLTQEINAREQVQVALTESEQNIRLVMDTIAEGFYLVDASGDCVLINESGVRLLGYERKEELIGRHIHELIHHTRPDGAPYPAHECRMYQAMRDNRTIHADDELFWRRDGTAFPVEYWSYPIVRAGQMEGAVASFFDITERKHSERRLHLQSSALSAAANEVVITDQSGTIQWVNPAFTKTTGYTLEEAVGQNSRILKSGKHDSAFYRQFWATILRGEVWRGEMVNRKKDGSLFTEESIITPVKDERGEITHFIAIKQDISEKMLLEAKFLRAQRLEGLGALAGGVAHDLNNVLAPILMASELLKSQSTDPNTRHLLEMIEGNSQRGAGMIRQILAFARGTAGEKIVLQAGHLMKDISKMMKETFPPNIRCELRVAGGLEPVLGESTELYQILLNLCVNARDAMPKGGTLTLGAENIRLDETYASLSHEARPGHYVVLSVADTGGGIPEEIRGKIFEPFFTTKEPGKGTGLGLATVKDIVTGHGGFIHLYSEVGVGTQFKIYLPAARGEEAEEGTTFLSLPGGHSELVLVVDDEAAVREIVKSTLEGYGYRVVTANDGTEGVARFFEHSKEVQLLLTDIQMPLMDGMALIRALRNVQPDLRVIAASGLNTHEAALKATGLEVQGFIPKPFTAASLLLALDAALHPK